MAWHVCIMFIKDVVILCHVVTILDLNTNIAKRKPGLNFGSSTMATGSIVTLKF